MARTLATASEEISPGSVTRTLLNSATAGSAVITKVIAGTGIAIASTGVDSGTGDVTISVTGAVVAKGTAIVDFGAGGATDALVAVTGHAGIVATSSVVASVLAMASADHSADEHWAETLTITPGNIIAGTGFTIYAKCGNSPCFGKFNVAWTWA